MLSAMPAAWRPSPALRAASASLSRCGAVRDQGRLQPRWPVALRQGCPQRLRWLPVPAPPVLESPWPVQRPSLGPLSTCVGGPPPKPRAGGPIVVHSGRRGQGSFLDFLLCLGPPRDDCFSAAFCLPEQGLALTKRAEFNLTPRSIEGASWRRTVGATCSAFSTDAKASASMATTSCSNEMVRSTSSSASSSKRMPCSGSLKPSAAAVRTKLWLDRRDVLVLELEQSVLKASSRDLNRFRRALCSSSTNQDRNATPHARRVMPAPARSLSAPTSVRKPNHNEATVTAPAPVSKAR